MKSNSLAIKTLIALLFFCLGFNKAYSQQQYYDIEGFFNIRIWSWNCKNSNGVVEKISFVLMCVADCGIESIYYESSNMPNIKIRLEIVEETYFYSKKIQVRFSNDERVYTLDWSEVDRIRCHNPDGTIQSFKITSF